MPDTGTTSTVSPFSGSENPAVSVTFENLSKSFDEFAVLRDISFKVEPGERTARVMSTCPARRSSK